MRLPGMLEGFYSPLSPSLSANVCTWYFGSRQTVSLVPQIHTCRGMKPRGAGHTQPCVVAVVQLPSGVHSL